MNKMEPSHTTPSPLFYLTLHCFNKISNPLSACWKPQTHAVRDFGRLCREVVLRRKIIHVETVSILFGICLLSRGITVELLETKTTY